MTRWCAIVTGMVLAATPGARADPTPSPDQLVLSLVNRYRATAGVAPVQLDPKLSAGCMEHANYMRLNRGTAAMQGLSPHHQDPSLPGASLAGAACGVSADLFQGVADLQTAVDGWMSGLYHRRPILSPQLASIGVGYAQLPDGTLMAALMLVDSKDAGAGWPIAYPARDQQTVPLEMGGEIPNPAPAPGAGYPITLEFPPFDPVTNVTATLTDADGHAAPIYLSDPEHPATSFGQYGVVCMIPQQRLRASTRYRVHIRATWGTAGAHDYDWSFTTIGRLTVDAGDANALLAALGQPSHVRGVVQYAGAMDSATTFLALAAGASPRYEIVSVLVPTALFPQLAHGADPNALVGATLEVDTTPQLYGKSFNLPIDTAAQFAIVAPPPPAPSQRTRPHAH